MTDALCFRCGNIKFWALCGCPECGVEISGPAEFAIVFSDHHMSRTSLEKFGDSIKLLHSHRDNEDVCFWAFIQFISDKHPSYLSARVPESIGVEVESLLAKVEHPHIEIEQGIDEQIEKEKAEKRAQKQRARSEGGSGLGKFLDKLFKRSCWRYLIFFNRFFIFLLDSRMKSLTWSYSPHSPLNPLASPSHPQLQIDKFIENFLSQELHQFLEEGQVGSNSSILTAGWSLLDFKGDFLLDCRTGHFVLDLDHQEIFTCCQIPLFFPLS